MNYDIYELILGIPIFLLSLSIHEYAHAKVAVLLGDPTPKFMGRLTLDPRAHIDLMGLLALIITRRIGWAKPVSINPSNFKHGRKGMMLVGLAGPMSNFLLAGATSVLVRVWISLNPTIFYSMSSLTYSLLFFLITMALTNIGLGIFNLFPIPPLDGSRILGGIIPPRYLYYLDYLEGPVGMMVILFLAFTGLFGKILGPLIFFVARLMGLPV